MELLLKKEKLSPLIRFHSYLKPCTIIVKHACFIFFFFVSGVFCYKIPLIIQIIELQRNLIGNEAVQLSHVHLTGKNCRPWPSPQLNGFYLISGMFYVPQSHRTWKGQKSLLVLVNLSVLDYLNPSSSVISFCKFSLFSSVQFSHSVVSHSLRPHEL